MRKRIIGGVAAAGAVLLTNGLSAPTPAHARSRGVRQVGLASYYGRGQRTASGERFNPGALTAAHRTLPLGSLVRVRNLKSGKAITVRINDRGPYVGGRVIDLSTRAAQAIGMTGQGVARVEINTQNVRPVRWSRRALRVTRRR